MLVNIHPQQSRFCVFKERTWIYYFITEAFFFSLQKGQRSAILTTHSMEEADALCARIGILVRGGLRYVIYMICY